MSTSKLPKLLLQAGLVLTVLGLILVAVQVNNQLSSIEQAFGQANALAGDQSGTQFLNALGFQKPSFGELMFQALTFGLPPQFEASSFPAIVFWLGLVTVAGRFVLIRTQNA